jgi:hypothetical protein
MQGGVYILQFAIYAKSNDLWSILEELAGVLLDSHVSSCAIESECQLRHKSKPIARTLVPWELIAGSLSEIPPYRK